MGILKAESTGLADVEVIMGVGSGIQGEAWVSRNMIRVQRQELRWGDRQCIDREEPRPEHQARWEQATE